MEQKLGKIVLLKNQFKKCLENKNLEEAESVLRVINEEYKNISDKSLIDILDQEQIENIEKCFGKKIPEIVGNPKKENNGIELE